MVRVALLVKWRWVFTICFGLQCAIGTLDDGTVTLAVFLHCAPMNIEIGNAELFFVFRRKTLGLYCLVAIWLMDKECETFYSVW